MIYKASWMIFLSEIGLPCFFFIKGAKMVFMEKSKKDPFHVENMDINLTYMP